LEIAMTYTPANEHALGYAEGREDASGVRTASPTEAPGCLVFAEAYAVIQRWFDAQVTHWMPCIRDAYEQWQAAGGRPNWANPGPAARAWQAAHDAPARPAWQSAQQASRPGWLYGKPAPGGAR
jgi:hypothetical protein